MIDFHTIKYILSMITRSYKETSTSCCCCFLNKPKRMCVCVKAWQSVRKRDRRRVQTMPNGQKNRKKTAIQQQRVRVYLSSFKAFLIVISHTRRRKVELSH